MPEPGPSGVEISREAAAEFLRDHGVRPDHVPSYLRSFDDGPITLRVAEPGETFYRYTRLQTPGGQGRFLTKAVFATPEEAVRALHLAAYGNDATLRQAVVATRVTLVLEGGIRNSPIGERQTVVGDLDAFTFGTGTRYP